jgi:low temperature requirement protein LtrA
VTDVEHREAREPLIRPPRLHLGRAGHASRLELFFDLAYVLVVYELGKSFVENLSWSGLLVLAGLFITIWFSWVGFTLYANRFDTDDIIFRIAKLLATLAIGGCAASASDAVGKYAVPFAASFLAGRILLLLLYARAWRHVEDARPTIRVYLATTGASALLWAVSLAVPGDARYLLWAAAVLIDAVGPLVATLRTDKLPLHIEHLPERFALLVILVLGEAVGGAARGVHDASWAPVSVLVGLAGFAVAAALWWIYFDTAGHSSARGLEETEDDETEQESPEVDQRHDLFVYGHLPLTFGVVLVGVGIEVLVLRPDVAAPSAGSWVLSGGLALFLIGAALLVGGTVRTWRAVWPWPLAVAPVVLVVALLPIPHALLLIGAYAAVMITLAVVGTWRSRKPETALASSS